MWRSLGLLVLVIYGVGCAKKPASSSGISQFWTDEYKVFDQVYGKTSDKDLYGATLPPNIAYGIDPSKLKLEASEKKERYLENHQSAYVDEVQDPYGFGARYPSLTSQGAVKTVKPPKISTKFIPADFKPIISKNNDPETYEYLKHLELLQNKKQNFLLPNAGFNSYLNGTGSNPEDVENYKSIQDILDAHEANKGKKTTVSDDDGDQVKYLTYGNPKPRGSSKKAKPPVTFYKGKPGKPSKPPCHTGRCRKRATTSYRGRTYLTRPMIRKIKKVYYS